MSPALSPFYKFFILIGEGCDNQNGKYPWQIGYWRFGNYKSVMNYRYAYAGLDNKVDYSDGSHGLRDFDDWGFMDFQFFQRPQF